MEGGSPPSPPKKMLERLQRFYDHRPTRWLLVLMLLGGVALYVGSGFTSKLFREEKKLNPPIELDIDGTIRAIEVIERNLKLHSRVNKQLADERPNELGELSRLLKKHRDDLLDARNKTETSNKMVTKTKNQLPPPALKPKTALPEAKTAQTTKVIAQYSHVNSIPNVRVTDVNCAKLFSNDKEELKRAEIYQKKNTKVPIPDEEYPKLTRNCDTYKRERQYVLQPLSQNEAEFPIAFSMVIFKDIEQVERLLRAIYRPQNYYCIHVDAKASQAIRDAMDSIAKCFDNVFLSSRSIDVQWGWFSVLEPELVCMEDLIKYKKWKYFINLTGQEWPLKTNDDLVKILKIFNGGNSMEGTVKRRNVDRTVYIHNGYWATDKKKTEPPPKGITLTKGSLHITVSRAYVEYVLFDPLALEFRKWVNDTGVPDETFFTSLNHSPQLGVPGAYKGEPETDPKTYPFITRFKNWGTYPFDYPCKGQRVRMVCVFSVGDLGLLSTRPELFANKFYLDYEPLALDCMEELHYNRTRQAVTGERQFNTLFYHSLPFVKNHV